MNRSLQWLKIVKSAFPAGKFAPHVYLFRQGIGYLRNEIDTHLDQEVVCQRSARAPLLIYVDADGNASSQSVVR